jgi:hypothetical protein
MLRLLLPLALANSVGLGFIDRGIFPDLNAGVRISPPAWPVLATADPAAKDELWLRLDAQHKVLTLYQADIALTAYALRGEVAVPPGQGAGAPLGAVLAQLAPEDASELRGRVGAPVRARRVR